MVPSADGERWAVLFIFYFCLIFFDLLVEQNDAVFLFDVMGSTAATKPQIHTSHHPLRKKAA